MPTDVVGTQPPVLSGPPFQEIAKSDRAAPDALWAFLKTAHNSVSHPGNISRARTSQSNDLADLRVCEVTARSAMTTRLVRGVQLLWV